MLLSKELLALKRVSKGGHKPYKVENTALNKCIGYIRSNLFSPSGLRNAQQK